jgi:hypothetical protein
VDEGTSGQFVPAGPTALHLRPLAGGSLGTEGVPIQPAEMKCCRRIKCLEANVRLGKQIISSPNLISFR